MGVKLMLYFHWVPMKERVSVYWCVCVLRWVQVVDIHAVVVIMHAYTLEYTF